MEKALLVAMFVLLFTECSVAASVKKPSPTNSSQDCPTTQQGEGCTLGLTKEQPADSCYHIFTCNPQGQSGMYWIRNGPTVGEGAHQFFCELEEERCGLRGLMRVAHINMSEPCFTCPPPLAQYWANGTKVCGPAVSGACDSVVFPVHGVKYNYVCGRAVGYSFYYPIGLYFGADDSYSFTIDQHYLSGLSITHGAPGSRNHIWSYAAGLREDTSHAFNCPCAAHPSTEPLTPDYVGDHYYCDTATYYHPKREWYTNNTLWDGKDCYSGSKCCSNDRLPWFWRTLPQETTDDVEVRWCTQKIRDDKVSTELLEIFVH